MIITCRDDGLVISTSPNLRPESYMHQYDVEDVELDLVLQWQYVEGELTPRDPYYYEKIEALEKKALYQQEGDVKRANEWGIYHAKLVNNIPAERPE